MSKTIIFLLFATTLGASAQRDLFNDDSVLIEQEAASQARAEIESEQKQQYSPEAAVAAGIKPSPPIEPRPESFANLGNAEIAYQRALDRYNQELERYNNALARWTQQQAAAEEARQQQKAQQQAEAQEKAKTQQQNSFDQRWEKSRQIAWKRYPDSHDENSDFSKKVIEIWERLEREGNPIVNDPTAPQRVADMAAGALGVSPTQ